MTRVSGYTRKDGTRVSSYRRGTGGSPRPEGSTGRGTLLGLPPGFSSKKAKRLDKAVKIEMKASRIARKHPKKAAKLRAKAHRVAGFKGR